MCPIPQSLLLPRKCAFSVTALTLHSVSSGPERHPSAAPASVPVSTAPPGPPEPTVLPEYGLSAGLSAVLTCLPQDGLLHLPSEIPIQLSPPSSGLGLCLYSPGTYLAPAHARLALLTYSMLAPSESDLAVWSPGTPA